MAAITINGLKCALVYNITAGGTLNGTLVGPRSFHGTITAGSCPINCITTTSASGMCICTFAHMCDVYYTCLFNKSLT